MVMRENLQKKSPFPRTKLKCILEYSIRGRGLDWYGSE